MQAATLQQPVETTGFVDRRRSFAGHRPDGPERRQFRDGNASLNSEVRELQDAIDTYKVSNHRKFITTQELYDVIYELGYRKF